MTNLKKLLRLLKDRSGATVIEYCLIAGIIGIAIVGGATVMGDKTNGTFTTLNTQGFGG
ncbi:MAG: Flp family type IVb pilin [Sphingomonadales bacterium]|nr:MAG: Flp family type IVb pilin [Sphingomonadales bacterium]